MTYSALVKPKSKPHRVHFIGIGGIAMSGLARWFRGRGWRVTGSDVSESITIEELRGKGVQIRVGQERRRIPRPTDLVIYTRAVGMENPEIRDAVRRRIATYSNAQIVGWLTRGYRTLAIAGAHGKSTTTALLGSMLIAAGFDPTILVGTRVKGLSGGNFRPGRSDWLVLEADEYGRSFLNYSPVHAIITNIDREHLDTYRDLSDVKRTFLRFLGRVAYGGTLVLNRDDEHLRSLRRNIARIGRSRHIKITWYSVKADAAQDVRHLLRIPGEHNVSNALAALALALAVGVPRKKALAAIGAFRGTWRRLEYRGKAILEAGRRKLEADIYDDYAHHPAEIRATLKAIREAYSRRPLICVFQPHQALRLKKLFREFQTAFNDADATIVLPVYRVAGRDMRPDPRYDAPALVRAVQKRYPEKRVFNCGSRSNIKSVLTSALFETPNPSGISLSPIVIMMGAGDIVDHTDLLINGSARSR